MLVVPGIFITKKGSISAKYVSIMARSHIQQICLLEDKVYENIADYNLLFTFIDFRRATNLEFYEKPQ